jgi:cob(I)alamin adenosyltransferase
MTDETPQSQTERHNAKMKKVKVARDRMMETKTVEKGLIIIHTGKGKGKTTAAMGMVCRAIGHGQRVAIVQFIKGALFTGEKIVFDAFPDQVVMRSMGEGFTWETQDRDRDIAVAKLAWDTAKAYIADPDYKMVLLDELNIALRYDYVPLADVIATLKNKPADKHVILTGRNAKDELIEIADLVTDMVQVKHPFRDGVKAQEGIEF